MRPGKAETAWEPLRRTAACKHWHAVFVIILSLIAVSTSSSARGDQHLFPGDDWPTATAEELGMNAEILQRARDYALTGDGSGLIIRRGRIVIHWGDLTRRYDLKSTSKSIGVTALGIAIADEKVRLDDPAIEHHPHFAVPPVENADTPWRQQITLRHLATHTAGFEKPGGYTQLFFEPGTRWAYSDGGPNWLAECLTLAYGEDIERLLFKRVFTPIGITQDDLRWRKNPYRPHELDGIPRREFGSGVHANVDAMARIGYLYLREGKWSDQQLLPAEFVAQTRTTVPQVVGLPVVKPDEYGQASDHYGLLWWNNADGALADIPRDAYRSWGLYDSLIVVIPNLDLVAARAGKSWIREGGDHYDVLKPFLEPIARSVSAKTSDDPRVPPAPPAKSMP